MDGVLSTLSQRVHLLPTWARNQKGAGELLRCEQTSAGRSDSRGGARRGLGVAPPQSRPAVFAYGRASFYARCSYQNASSSLMQPQDLHSTLDGPADHGISGVILWGSSADCMQPTGAGAMDRCADQASFIRASLGPVAAAAVARADSCAITKCRAGEHCVYIDKHGVALPQPVCPILGKSIENYHDWCRILTTKNIHILPHRPCVHRSCY